MGVLVPGQLGESVDDRTIHSARPTYGRTAGTFASQAVALLGYRGLRTAVKDWEMAQVPADGVDAAGLRTSWYIPFVCGPLGAHLWVGIWLYAEDISTGSAPSMTISLEETDGTSIDTGFDLSQDNGFIFSSPPRTAEDLRYGWTGLNPATLGVVGNNDAFVHTPHLISSGNTPRLLNATGFEGEIVVVRIQTSAARLYSGVVSEAYRSRIG